MTENTPDARLWKGVDSQVEVAARDMNAVQKSQPEWLWFENDLMCLSFGRWCADPVQAPYIRADIAMQAAMPAPGGPVVAYRCTRPATPGEFELSDILVWGHETAESYQRDGWVVTALGAMPAPAGVTRPSDKKLREAYALSDLICPETTTVEAEMLGIWNVLNGDTRGLLDGAGAREGAELPSDGSCVRCGAVPRNASGLCATCVDEDAERAGEIEDVEAQGLWRQALDQERVPAPAGAGDLVERLLRNRGPLTGEWPGPSALHKEAASRIEALEAEVARLIERNAEHEARFTAESIRADAYKAMHAQAEADLAALRAEVELLKRLGGQLANVVSNTMGRYPAAEQGPARETLNLWDGRTALAPAKGG